MNRISLLSVARALAAGFAILAGSAVAQSGASDIPRTASGKPNFQGHWSSATITPLERPRNLGDKEFYTPDEYKAVEAASLGPREPPKEGTQGDVHYQLSDYALDRSQNLLAVNLRTSIITDPADGRIPPTTPEADAIAAAEREHSQKHGYDSAKDRPLAERCIVWPHNGPPMLPVGYNSNNEIIQTDNNLVFIQEMMQEPRIIPLDGEPRLPDDIEQWRGSSSGHWEGDTIVVETSNFTGLTARNISPTGKVTERFTMTGPDTMLYEFTVDDPETWTAPWSGQYTLTRAEGPMFEYACHEGNYGIANILKGIRADEAAGER